MRRTVRIIIALSVAAFIVAVMSCNKSPSEPNLLSHFLHDSIYVAAGAQGLGTFSSPMGSIQSAIIKASQYNPKLKVIVSGGLYHECVRFEDGVSVSGSRDQSNWWQLSAVDSTVIVGSSDDSIYVTALFDSIHSPTGVDHLKIVGPDASLQGAASFAAIVIDCDSLEIVNCFLIGGIGADGQIGLSGADGESSPEKARGGQGGRVIYQPPCSGADGKPGNCYPDSIFAGMGGSGGGAFIFAGGGGGGGQNGIEGVAGNNGTLEISLIPSGGSYTIVAPTGTDGQDGQWGCGGGGGGALLEINHGDGSCVVSAWGTDGGNGGGGGAGGRGGIGGGSSVGILAVRSVLSLHSCHVSTASAGVGGNGGGGGKGVPGSPGQPNPYPDFLLVGVGGKGGNGGRGGAGGGGTGGCVFAIASYKSVVQTDSTTVLTCGQAGLGGGPWGAKAPTGLSQLRFEFDSISTPNVSSASPRVIRH